MVVMPGERHEKIQNILLVLNPEVQETAALDKAVSLTKRNDARLTLKPEGFVTRVTFA